MVRALFEVIDEENRYNSDIKEWPLLGRIVKKLARQDQQELDDKKDVLMVKFTIYWGFVTDRCVTQIAEGYVLHAFYL